MATDSLSLTFKSLDELDDLSLPLVSGTDSMIVVRGNKPYLVDLDDLISFIS